MPRSAGVHAKGENTTREAARASWALDEFLDKTGKRAEAPLDRALAVGKRFMTLIEQVTD